MVKSEFGMWLKATRLKLGMTQIEAADGLQMAVSFYSALEIGRRQAPPRALNALEEFFELDEVSAMRMHRLAAKSVDQIRINTREASDQGQDVALQFARSFDSMDDIKLKRLKDLLEGFDDA